MKSNKIKIIIAIGILIVFIIPFIINIYKNLENKKESSAPAPQPIIKTYDPPFVKEGELDIIDATTGKLIKRISIEIAEDQKEISQGLMYRTSMLDTLGMLFIFEQPGEHIFWMKNTIIPLDIIFVNEQQKVVTIQRNTTPYSENQIHSEKPVLYVIEVNAGFCDRYGVKVGDRIRFDRNSVPL